MMNRTLSIIFFLLVSCATSFAQQVTFDHGTLTITGDSMAWTLRTEGSQYPWVTEQYRWGTTYYEADGAVGVSVERRQEGDDLVETYIFTNPSKKRVRLKNIGIYTPFNDNYPDAKTCMTGRCNAHINANGKGAWVNALRMNGVGPHLGLVVAEGAICGYDVWERGARKGSSNFRGVIALCPPDLTLKPGKSYRLSWRLFAHHGEDFEQQLLRRGGTVVKSDKFIYQLGETARVDFMTAKGKKTLHRKIDRTGELTLTCQGTQALLLGISSEQQLMAKRVQFILDHQQYHNAGNPRDGAFMIYDCEGDSLLTDDRGRSDLSEGRERLGMGIALAAYGMRYPSSRLNESLLRYVTFVRQKLQHPDYRTKSDARQGGKNRGYNYAWAADFFFRMALLTGEKQYALDGYATLQSLYRQFGYGFYCIDYPVTVGLKALEKARLRFERDMLLYDFQQTADILVKNGLNFPSFEVNYEQSIIAPAVQFLCEIYLVTKNPRYLRGAETLLPALEALQGRQSNYRQYEIAIRHWDGYWFGKRQTFGDVYPHYWSAITGAAFHYYAKATGKLQYQQRAEQIARGNLSLFFENGEATCAFVFPRRVNGVEAHYADALANDQDCALMWYLLVNE